MFANLISSLLRTEHRAFLIRLLFGLAAIEFLLYWIASSMSPSLSLLDRLVIFDDERQRRQVLQNYSRWNARLVRKWRQHSQLNITVLPDCPAIPPNLVGPLRIWLPKKSDISQNVTTVAYSSDLIAFEDESSFEWSQLLDRYRNRMFDGGHFRPPTCRARQKVAIIVPYRNRDEHLRTFINHMLPILKRQQRDFKIYVMEQFGNDEKFNRGTLFNVGYVEALREYDWQCVIFHDVDLLPENDRHLYECSDERHPIRLSSVIDKHRYKLPYADLFGGAEAFPVKTFRDINGFSNLYWGWGGEDDDLSARVHAKRYRIIQPDEKVARYKMIKHVQNHEVATDRHELLKYTQTSMNFDGLSSLVYKIRRTNKMPLFTHLMVEIHRDDYVGDEMVLP